MLWRDSKDKTQRAQLDDARDIREADRWQKQREEDRALMAKTTAAMEAIAKGVDNSSQSMQLMVKAAEDTQRR